MAVMLADKDKMHDLIVEDKEAVLEDLHINSMINMRTNIKAKRIRVLGAMEMVPLSCKEADKEDGMVVALKTTLVRKIATTRKTHMVTKAITIKAPTEQQDIKTKDKAEWTSADNKVGAKMDAALLLRMIGKEPIKMVLMNMAIKLMLLCEEAETEIKDKDNMKEMVITMVMAHNTILTTGSGRIDVTRDKRCLPTRCSRLVESAHGTSAAMEPFCRCQCPPHALLAPLCATLLTILLLPAMPCKLTLTLPSQTRNGPLQTLRKLKMQPTPPHIPLLPNATFLPPLFPYILIMPHPLYMSTTTLGLRDLIPRNYRSLKQIPSTTSSLRNLLPSNSATPLASSPNSSNPEPTPNLLTSNWSLPHVQRDLSHLFTSTP